MLMPAELVEKDQAVEFQSQVIAIVGYTIIGSTLDVVMQSEHLGDVLEDVQDKFEHWYVAPEPTWWESPICRVVIAMEVVFEKTYCIDAGEYEYDTIISVLGLVDVAESIRALEGRIG